MRQNDDGSQTQRQPQPEAQRWQWGVASVLLLAMWGLANLELTAVFARGGWIVASYLIFAAVLAAAMLLRLSVRPVAPLRLALAGMCAGGVVWIVSVAARGRFGAWAADPATEMAMIWQRIETGAAPVAVHGPLEDALLCAVLLVSVVTVGFFVRGWWLSAGVSIALLLLVPVVITGVRVPIATLLVGGVLLALIVWVNSPQPRPAGFVAAGLVLVVAAGLFQLVPDKRDRVWNTAVLFAPVSTTVPDVTVALAEDLRKRSDTIAFKAMGSYPGTNHFTLATLVDFEGGKWLPQAELNEAGDTAAVSRRSVGLEEIILTGDTRQIGPSSTITIKGLRSTWLPLPRGAMIVDGIGEFDTGEWAWVEGASTIRSETSITRDGDQYNVVSFPAMTYEMFSMIDSEFIETYRPSVRLGTYANEEAYQAALAPYVALPEGMPDELRETANSVAGDAETALQVGARLQQYFIGGQFSYDETSPYEPGADPDDSYAVMTAFLDQRSGFCVHYASAFAVMARELGIPTRLSVGYAATVKPEDRGVEVRGTDLHAWPEIFVEGMGWVAFEPTPGGSGGGVARNGQNAEAQQTEEREIQRESSRAPVEVPVDVPEDTPDEVSEKEADRAALGAGLTLGLLGAGVILLLMTPAIVRLARRKARLIRVSREERPAQQAWAEIVDLAVDFALLTRATPLRARTPAALIEYLVRQGELSNEGIEAMRLLAERMEAERYGGEPGAQPEEVAACVEGVRRELAARATARTRIAAVAMPRSVLRRRPM